MRGRRGRSQVWVAAGVTIMVVAVGVTAVVRGGDRRQTSVSVTGAGADDALVDGVTTTTPELLPEATTTSTSTTTTTSTSAPPGSVDPLRPAATPVPERCGMSSTTAPTGDVVAVVGGGGLREVGLDGGEHVIGAGREDRAYVGQAEWSPSGRVVAHETDGVLRVTDVLRDCTRDVVAADPARPDLRPFSWSDDERRVTFIQQGYMGAPRPWQVHVVTADGTGRRPFVKADSGVVWAPDGSGRIAYCDATGLKVLDERTGKVTMVHATDRVAEHPAWSPDATRLVYSMSLDSGVWVAPASGGPGRKITDSWQVFWSSWSPDGKRLAYAYENELWTVDADGSNPRRLTSGAQTSTKPFWSPDGRHIAFTAGGFDANQRVMVVGADGTNLRTVAESGAVVAFFRR